MKRCWSGLPVVIFGIGGAARDVVTLIDDINTHSATPQFDIVGFVAHEDSLIGELIAGYEIVSSNNNFIEFARKFSVLGVIIGIGSPEHKKSIFHNFLTREPNLVFPNLIHPTAKICGSKFLNLGLGVTISAGATFGYYTSLSDFVTINHNAVIGHDSEINDFCSINPQAVISGNVVVGRGTLIGAGATVREKIVIGSGCTVGMGTVVVKDIENNSVFIGNPARKI